MSKLVNHDDPADLLADIQSVVFGYRRLPIVRLST